MASSSAETAVRQQLAAEAQSAGVSLCSEQMAQCLDRADELSEFRQRFHLPKDIAYMSGNSLGLMPKDTARLIAEEVQVWSECGVEGHTEHPYGRDWARLDEQLVPAMASLVGAQETEVAIMESLTTNMHLLFAAFYVPTASKYKILMEESAFPSDRFAVESQIRHHGFDVAKALVTVPMTHGTHGISTEAVLAAIEEHADTLALVWLPGVQYMTGQNFDMQAIAAKAHEKGCVAGFDLAHAVGNLPLSLHDWHVDFAVWGSYKYLNAGPGGIGGLFVHADAKYDRAKQLHGWWGQQRDIKFQMEKDFDGLPGAGAFQVSNPSALNLVCLQSSLSLFREAGMDRLSRKSQRLTMFMRMLLEQQLADKITIMTPEQTFGCQLSLMVNGCNNIDQIKHQLRQQGVICDGRSYFLRMAPVPLYNSFQDVWKVVRALTEILNKA